MKGSVWDLLLTPHLLLACVYTSLFYLFRWPNNAFLTRRQTLGNLKKAEPHNSSEENIVSVFASYCLLLVYVWGQFCRELCQIGFSSNWQISVFEFCHNTNQCGCEHEKKKEKALNASKHSSYVWREKLCSFSFCSGHWMWDLWGFWHAFSFSCQNASKVAGKTARWRVLQHLQNADHIQFSLFSSCSPTWWWQSFHSLDLAQKKAISKS